MLHFYTNFAPTLNKIHTFKCHVFQKKPTVLNYEYFKD